MQKDVTYISDTAYYSSHLPLESLIIYLKNNGFSIKPDDYIEILKVVERFRPATLNEAANLICPLITTSEEEQVKFYTVFEKLCETDPIVPPPPPWWKKLLNWFKTHRPKKRAWYLLLIIPVLVIISWVSNIPAIWRHSPTMGGPARIRIAVGENTRNIGDTIKFFVVGQTEDPDSEWQKFQQFKSDTNKVTLEWNLGNGWESRNKHMVMVVPSKLGAIQAMVRLMEGKNLIMVDKAEVHVCGRMPVINITSDNDQDVVLNSVVKLKVMLSPNSFPGASGAWIVNGDTLERGAGKKFHLMDAQNTDTLSYTLKKIGSYNIWYISIPRPEYPDCYTGASQTFSVKDPNAIEYKLQNVQAGDPIKPPKKISEWIKEVFFFSFLAFLVASLVILWIKKRKKDAVKKVIDSVYDPPSVSPDKKPVFEIPLENRQQQLVASEPVMNDVMRFMHQRTLDEALGLNIKQTVQNTIRSGGIPELVYSNKLRYNDYLILIDSTVTNSQQLKLFEYLVKTFRNENISIVRFFYQDNFSKFYNEEFPAGLTVKRLSEVYKNYTLIIYGDAHHLVYEAYPVIDPERLNELADWENKGILTPIPFKDWTVKERILGEHIILLPADAQGQLRLIKAINEKLLRHRDFLSSEKDFYRAGKYDFSDPDEIRTYLDDEDLFQWVCAIAIYPHIRWEILIELGKAVLQSRGCPEKMNYTNLLKLVRISWLHDGYFQENTRLELLKNLGVSEEVVARKRLVEMFEYADLHYKDNYFFSTGKKMQEITNKFIIYANDPANNEALASSKEQFDVLWKNNKITDAPLKEYIDNSAKQPWKTPMVDKNGATVGTGEYLHKPGSLPGPSKLEKWARLFSLLGGLCFILAVGLSVFGKDLAKTSIMARFLGISTTDSSELVQVTVDVLRDVLCPDNNEPNSIDEVKLSLSDEMGNTFSPIDSVDLIENLQDDASYSQSFKIPFRSIALGSLLLEVGWKNGVIVDTFSATNYNDRDNAPQSQSTDLLFTTNRIKTTISACQDTSNTGIIIKYNAPALQQEVADLARTLIERGYENVSYSQESFRDSLKVKFYESNDRSIAERLANEVSDYFKRPYVASSAGNAGSVSRDRFEILVYKHIDSIKCTSVPISKLPASLTEIWRGETNNRLLNINLGKKTIYYSTGGTATYGRYTITEACLKNDTYTIILSGDKNFRVCIARNISRNAFQYSFCKDIYNTLDEARKASESNCGDFEDMRLYYPRDTGKIFIPVNAINYASSETAKIQKVLARLRADKNLRAEISYLTNNLLYPGKDNQSRRDVQIRDNSPFRNIPGVGEGDKPFNASPFDRDYMTIAIESSNPPIKPGNRKNGTEIIEFAPDSSILDGVATALIRRIGAVLEQYPDASISMVGLWWRAKGPGLSDARLEKIVNMLRSYNKFLPSQVQQRTTFGSENLENDPKSNASRIITINYSNFPSSFGGKSAN